MKALAPLVVCTALLAACGPTAGSGSGPTTDAPAATSTSAPPSPSASMPTDPAASMAATAKVTQQLADTLVGRSEADAIAAIDAASPPCTHRVVERDGESFMVTMDYSPSRINLSIAAGTVTKATVG